MATQKSSPITLFIVGTIFIVGAWLTYTNFSKPMTEEAEASMSWPKTPGIITNSAIHQSESDGKTMYSADIDYSFMIDGKEYSGERITLNGNATSTSSVREVKKDLQKYPVGAKVDVYYDPELPNNAVLKPGADFFTYVIKYAPFLVGLLGIAMLWQIVKKIGLLGLALFAGTRS